MAGSKLVFTTISCCSLIFYVLVLVNAKLNVPRVLLPLFQQFNSNFTLEVKDTIKVDGCYKWSSSRPDIVQVLPFDFDEVHRCSLKAVVSAVTKEPVRNTVIVLAEDIKSGFILRCDVIVDVVESLNIVTTTRELFMEEAPEMFEVRAEDNQGNEFTTLEGVEFSWRIDNLAQSSTANGVLRFISFSDSPYETPPSIEKFDTGGRQGHLVLIEGVKTGTAKVSVKLPYPEYSRVGEVSVLLTVVANLLLDPPDTHILAGDTVKFRLLQMQHGRLDEVTLPSLQYVLDVEDSEVLAIDRSVSMVRGLTTGACRVLLRDRHATEASAVKLPSASVVVTEPAYLRLALVPHNNWAVIVDEPASIRVQVFDRNNHRIHISDSVTIKTTVSEEYFRVVEMTRNGTVVDGIPVKVGTVPVTATLESVRLIGGEEVKVKPEISAHADMFIYPRLSVNPNHILVPWIPNLPKCEVLLKASGGDGSYHWRSPDVSVVTVSQAGLVKCTGLGATSVIVSMPRNSAIRAAAQVEVLPPSHIEILKHVVEAPVHKPIILHIVLYADKADENGYLKRFPMTHCRQIPFKLEFSNDNFFQNVTDHTKPMGSACATVAVIGRVIGNSKVKISYTVDDIKLEASTDVAAFSPLEVVHPEKKVAVLAVGTSRHVVWRGGPRIWLARSAEHTRSATSSSPAVSVQEVPSNSPTDYYVYSVFCRELGEYDVVLTVKNTAGNGKFRQTESFSSITVICAKPRFISFSPEVILNNTCPYSTDSSKIVSLSHQPVKVITTITDNQGRVFDNATSFHIDWLLSSKSLGHVQYDGVVMLEERKEYNYLIPLQHYQIIHPKNRTGTLIVEATVVDYRLQLLSAYRIVPENPAFAIENDDGFVVKPLIKTALTLMLVNEAIVTPERVTVFNHPKNVVVLKVTQGSGFYDFFLSCSDIAEVQYREGSKTVEVVPKSDGILQLTLIDLCLSYSSPIVEIQVLKVGSMQVEMLERVQRGSSITATVWLYDSVDNALAVPNPELLELRPLVQSSQLIQVTKLPAESTDGLVKFLITGLELGHTSVVFTSGYGDREIRSQPQPVEVFPPLRLNPQDITLPVGAVFQVTPSGGPQQDSNMEYTSSDSVIARINSAGLIEAQKIGDTSVTGMSIGHLKTTGGKVVYSRDEVNVHVIQLDGVKIQSPLSKIKVGCRMPVWATGVPEKLTPLVLGSIEPPLMFKWYTSVPDVIELQDVFHDSGLEVPDTDRLSMRVQALKPGRVTVHLNVSARSGKQYEFSDHLDIEVFEELALTKPQHFKPSILLMAPFSQMRLRTNKDSVSEVSYSVSGSAEGSLAGNQRTALSRDAAVISVSRAGLATSHAVLGTAAITITSVEDFGLKQTLPVTIEVRPVHYIMLNVVTKLRVGENSVVSAFPRGLDLQFVISYHNLTGEVFAAARTDIRSVNNRADSVKVARGEVNGTIFAKLASYGSTVLKVWDENTPKISEDFVKLRVDHLITPSKAEVTVGDVLCFSMPLRDEEGAQGRWSSASPDVVAVEMASGLARALRPGQVLVKFALSETITTSTRLQVHPIHSVVFLSLEGKNLTNWGSFSVPLLLLSERDGGSKSSNLLAQDSHCLTDSRPLAPHQLPFACEIRFNSPMAPVNIHHVFHVQPSFSIETGLYACRFEAINPPSANTSVLTSNVTLRAISDNLVSEPLVIPFLPSVFLPSTELTLTDHQLRTVFVVIGVPQVLQQVKVFLSDASFISVEDERRPDVNTAHYQVTIVAPPPALSKNVYLYVYSPLTGQNVTVPIHLTLRGGGDGLSAPCLTHPASQWLATLWDVAPTIISILVLALVLWFSNVFNWAQGPYAPTSNATSTPIAGNIYHNGSPQTRTFLYRQPFSDTEPVYGDPTLPHSPDMSRRNRSRLSS